MQKQHPAPAASIRFELCLLAILALLWGGSYGLIKLALETITPVTLVAVRTALAAGLLWLVVAWRGRAVPREPRIWAQLLVQGSINYMLPFTMITWGQQFVDSSLAGILNSTSPVFVFLFTVLWTRHEALDGTKFAGAAIGLSGVVLIVGYEALSGIGAATAGQVAIVLATACYGMAAIYGRRFAGISPVVVAAATLTLAALCLIPASFIVEQPLALDPSRRSILALVALSALSTAVAFVIYFRLMNTLGSLGAASVAYLRAAIAALIGVMLLGEPFTASLVIGLAAVIVGVAAINGQLRWPFTARRTRR